MKKTQKILMTCFAVSILFCLVLVLLFETEQLSSGMMADNNATEFYVLGVMELTTICLIPFSLRLFKFKKIHERLLSGKAKSLLPWGLLRLVMLALPMMLNTVFYYLFLHVGFGYMAIIGFLCMMFVVPTMARCQSETEI